ncbi:MAG: 16S rRNA (adenine(1518)-N(6)/adenine(1519)-N(6))-dimethyltransferase RsmA [Thermodesulfobacteriota bacterium]|nr:16S rRNA (adenine(1518)-N(6)/adenine(1519)-N(6))-dimethyltransferase RsmA [Thermodesulfobacteriota bacterium]
MSIRRQLRELQIRPKKRLGQHFVTDPQILSRILDCAALTPEDVVVEIGAGLGSLTVPLAKRVRKVYAIELDPRLVRELKKQFFYRDCVEVIQADALQFDFAPLYGEWQRKMKVVANLPYEISSPMIFRLFQERRYFSLYVLMLQMEVAKRVVARPGTKDYGPLSLWSELYTRTQIAFAVGPQAFYPQPKVESAVVRLDILQMPSVDVPDEKILQQIIRSAFTYRRKTLSNALRLGSFSHVDLKKIQDALHSVKISPLSRGEALSLEQFRDLAQRLAALS